MVLKKFSRQQILQTPWPHGLAWLLVAAAFLLGVAGDAVGSASHTVNIMAPPLLLLMLWNLIVYAIMLGHAFFKSRHFKRPALNLSEASSLARGTSILHLSAAALALGALVAMYGRGLVFDYQAAWQSTFLSAQSAHGLIGFVLAPAVWLGSFLGGGSLPDLNHFTQLRAPAGTGENAARWIHWYAITVLAVVLLPRGLLAWLAHRKAAQLMAQQTQLMHKPSGASAVQAEAKTYTSIQTIALSLVAHTNVGKTTLARTLLGRDVGEVRDAEHVTHTAERHVLVEAQNQNVLERLELWDTPGFGDSELLAKRMAQAGNPIGWFLSQVWDRFQNRAFWYSQRAVRHILDESDVVLYLVNASEHPAEVTYLDAELKVLDLMGKPVVVLLNQVNPTARPTDEQAQLQDWRTRVAQAPCVKAVLLLDAFTRCWVQEGQLLEAVAQTLPKQQALFARLIDTWKIRNRQRWHASMAVLAQRLARAACDKEIVKDSSLLNKLTAGNSEKTAAMQRLAQRLDTDVRSSTDALIALHQLKGNAALVVLNRLEKHVALQAPQSEGKAALWGGMVTGALMGLKADVLSGGLTLGGGMIAGGVLGALGAAGLARGYNYVKGVDAATLAWTPDVLNDLTRSALLAYLAVAHFGRGRGEWTEIEPPALWVQRIEAALQPHQAALQHLWRQSAESATADPAANTTRQASLQAELQAILIQASQAVLAGLYPDADVLQQR